MNYNLSNKDRNQPCPLDEARERVKYCLDAIQRAGFLDWQKDFCERLSYEEVIGALVGAEQHLKDM